MTNLTSTKLLLISHGPGCPDGFGAAWACYKKHPDAEFWFAQHKSNPPDVTGRDVVIVDFCYPRAQLLEMKAKAKSLIVLDHHATAQRDCGDLDFCHFDMTKSGAGLSWEYFHPLGVEVPSLLQYIQYRDLGFLFTRQEHPFEHIDEILSAVDSYPKTFEDWDSLAKALDFQLGSEAYDDIVIGGEAILRYKKQLLDMLLKNQQDLEIDGHKVKAINASFFQSELGNILAVDPANLFGAVWYQGADSIKFSLRSLESKLDVSKIAEKFPGGGGHRNASGFSIPTAKLEELLKCSSKK